MWYYKNNKQAGKINCIKFVGAGFLQKSMIITKKPDKPALVFLQKSKKPDKPVLAVPLILFKCLVFGRKSIEAKNETTHCNHSDSYWVGRNNI